MTIQGLSLTTLGGTGPEDLIRVSGGTIIQDNRFSGVYSGGRRGTSRAIDASPGAHDPATDANAISGLRRVGCLQANAAGNITDNRRSRTSRRVVGGTLAESTDNSVRGGRISAREDHGCGTTLCSKQRARRRKANLAAVGDDYDGPLLNPSEGGSGCDYR